MVKRTLVASYFRASEDPLKIFSCLENNLVRLSLLVSSALSRDFDRFLWNTPPPPQNKRALSPEMNFSLIILTNLSKYIYIYNINVYIFFLLFKILYILGSYFFKHWSVKTLVYQRMDTQHSLKYPLLS